MAKASIQSINTAQSFQNWFDKTNELVDLMREEVITASVGGDITEGDATLNGDFAATNITVNNTLFVDEIASLTEAQAILLNSPINIVGTSAVCSTFTFGAGGGRSRYTDGSTSWDIGMENSTSANFIINTGVGGNKFQLSPSGILTISDLVVTGTIGGVAFNDVGASVDSTDDVAEGLTNLYYTNARANSAIDARVTKTFVDNLGVNSSSVGGVQASELLKNNESGSIAGNLVVNGDISVTGNITTAFSVSDIRLKNNIVKIDKGLDKVNTLSGYTFNYKSDPSKSVAGLIAQELEQVLPEAVYEFASDEGESYKAIHYGNVVSLLVEAIKELSNKVDELEKRNSN